MKKKLIQTQCPLCISTILVCTLTLLASCNLQSYDSPEGYQFNKPQESELGKVLNEISGITYNTDDSTLLAISDSKKKIFQINYRKQKLKDFTGDGVGPDQDLEDLVKMDTAVYLLGSAGVIYEVPLSKDTGGVHSYTFPSEEKNDFETLYYDPSVNGLVMLCKSCASDKGKGHRSAYLFNLETRQFDTTAFYTIATDDIKKLVKDNDAKFEPSAAAIHPINKRLYILSSAGTLLVITDTRGKAIAGYNLNPDDYPQAEGIAFAPNGDMFISNEGKHGKPTLKVFRYQGEKKK